MRTGVFNFQVFISGIVFLTLSFGYSSAKTHTYGLKFKSFNEVLDNRTELDLSPNGFFKLKDEFEISFDYKTTRIFADSNSGFFGYVFRVITSEDKNIDLLSTPTPGIGLNLVVGETNSIIPAPYPIKYINNWISLRVKFELQHDRLTFYTPDTFYVKENIGFRSTEQLKIIFGANDYKQFKNSDVPSMTIKDVRIIEKGKPKYYWPLNEEEGDFASDEIKGKQAKVINPSWLTVSHQNWKKLHEQELNGIISVTADPEKGDIFMVGKDYLTIFSTITNTFRKVGYKNKPLFFDRNYRTIFNTRDRKIYSYVVDFQPLYSLDVESGEWGDEGVSKEFQTRYRHHNSAYNPSDNSIYVFGGYGLHTYNNEVVRIDLNKKTSNELPTDSDVFPPRYLAGLGSLNDTFYILGGYGSLSGNQLVNPQSYFDLLGYSVRDGSLFKKFDIERLIDDMIVGSSMWIDESSRDYYALVYSKIKYDNELQLIRGNLDSPEVKPVGNKIPFQFQDINTQVYLYYMPTKDRLYSYTSYTLDSTTLISIYSIDNPPNINEQALLAAKQPPSIYLYLAIVFLLLVGGTTNWIIRHRRKDARNGTQKTKSLEKEKPDLERDSALEATVQSSPNYNLILFGGFQVFNAEGEDITNKFSPLIKELFLLILLHTFKNYKGISSDRITEVLWYDKSVKSARNNRSVNIAKLRTILEEVGSCELTKKTGYWKLNCNGSQVKSDYFDFLNITSSENNLSKQKVNQLIEITEKGAFLLNVHYEWMDDFKASVSDTIIDTLVQFGQKCNVKKEADFIIHLADSIFNFDMINEDAMILKCKAQYCMGKHSHAKATYERFFKEYSSMYGQEYERAFLDVLELTEGLNV